MSSPEDLSTLIGKVEKRTRPLGWVLGFAAAFCIGAFKGGELYDRVSSQIATQTVIQQQAKADFDADRKSRDEKDAAVLKTLNELSTGQQLINQKLEDMQSKAP